MDVLDDRGLRRIVFCSFMLCFMKYLKAIKTNETLVQLNNDFNVMPGYNQYKLAYKSRTKEKQVYGLHSTALQKSLRLLQISHAFIPGT